MISAVTAQLILFEESKGRPPDPRVLPSFQGSSTRSLVLVTVVYHAPSLVRVVYHAPSLVRVVYHAPSLVRVVHRAPLSCVSPFAISYSSSYGDIPTLTVVLLDSALIGTRHFIDITPIQEI